MANSYSQLYVQLVFAVKHRQNFIQLAWKNNLYKYITAVVQNNRHKMLAVNGMPDHIPIFIGLNPLVPISDVVKSIKIASNNRFNGKQFIRGSFDWQSGYGAFSYNWSQISRVCNYIADQKKHHAHKTFKEECIALLEAFAIDYKEEHLFEFYD